MLQGGSFLAIPEHLELLAPWEEFPEPSEKRARLLSAELASELCPEHALYGLRARAVAARIDRDDVLFEIEGRDMPLVVVHLTWAKELDPHWPTTRFFASWEQWASEEMFPAHEEYNP
jgi:hypothetical protein